MQEVDTNPPIEEEELSAEVPGVAATDIQIDESGLAEGEIRATTPGVDETPDPAALQAEIDQLKKERERAEEAARAWRKEKRQARKEFFTGERGEAPPEPPPAPPVDLSSLGPEPVLANFDDYEEYAKAISKYEVGKAKLTWDAEQQRQAHEQTARERAEIREAKLQDGYAKYDDFEEVVFDRTATHITPMIADMLTDCENAADVAYALTKDRVLGVKISRMQPMQAAREIAKLDLKFANNPTPQKPPPKSKTTDAPEPITPIGGTGAGTGKKDPEKMTQAEYNEWRKEQGARPY